MKRIALFASLLLVVLFSDRSYAAVNVSLHGAQQYERTSGSPNVYLSEFPGIEGVGRITIVNGAAGGTNRVSSAIISINGRQIAGPQDFSQQVAVLEVPVSLAEQNSLRVELRSQRGSLLSIRVTQEIEAEAAGVIGPHGGVVQINQPGSTINGARVVIPPNELSTLKVITLSLVGTDRGGNPIVGIGPSGISFTIPVEIRLPYIVEGIGEILDERTNEIFAFDEVAQVWQVLPTSALDLDNNFVTGLANHFSNFTVGRDSIRHETPTHTSIGRPVLLVHGITLTPIFPRGDSDDTFGDLKNKLAGLGFDVWSFNYHTGRSIEISAGNLGKAVAGVLARKREAGFSQDCGVAIIAHSLGGLVSRTYVQSRALSWVRFLPYPETERVPYRGEVASLFLIAVPNHGARITDIAYPASYLLPVQHQILLRAYQLMRFSSAEALPESDFLHSLNDTGAIRVLPTDIDYHVVHGELLQDILTGEANDGLVRRSSSELSEWRTLLGYTITDHTVDAAHIRIPLLDWVGIAEIDRENHPTWEIIRTRLLPCAPACLRIDGEGLSHGSPLPGWSMLNPGDPLTSVTATTVPGQVHSGSGAVRVNGDFQVGRALDSPCQGLVTVDYWHFPQSGSSTNSGIKLYGADFATSEFLTVHKNDQNLWFVSGVGVVGSYNGQYTHVVITVNTNTGRFDVRINGQSIAQQVSVSNPGAISQGIQKISMWSGRAGAGTDSYIDDLMITSGLAP